MFRLSRELKRFSLGIFLSFFISTVQASGWIKDAGDIGRYAIPAAAVGATLFKKDLKGSGQLALSMAGYALVVEGILKKTVKEKRPRGQSVRSFPSGHAAAAFTAATFLQRRYGWKYGVPAYMAASFVGFSRIHEKAHHFHDVYASLVFSVAMGVVFTRPYESEKIAVKIDPDVGDQSVGLRLTAKLK